MRRTGVFYHDICRERDIRWLLAGRLRDFPTVLKSTGVLELPNVTLYTSQPVADELVLKVHTQQLLDEVRASEYYETARYSSGGTVDGSERIWKGEIDNCFVFTGSADHHAGRRHFWGGCHFNGATLAIANLREKYGARRFAIVDTDHHHGDGTRDIVGGDHDVLHVCFCGHGEVSGGGTNVDIPIGYHMNDEEYLRLVEREFAPRVRDFRPEMVFWEFGYDNTQGDYGDIGLSPEVHVRIAGVVKTCADEICDGRLAVILCGGAEPDTATHAIPRIIRLLAGPAR